MWIFGHSDDACRYADSNGRYTDTVKNPQFNGIGLKCTELYWMDGASSGPCDRRSGDMRMMGQWSKGGGCDNECITAQRIYY